MSEHQISTIFSVIGVKYSILKFLAAIYSQIDFPKDDFDASGMGSINAVPLTKNYVIYY